MALTVAGCQTPTSEPSPTEGGQWEGTVETDGTVTTIRNLGGSLWGGAASLVEEMSIGTEYGDFEYMFGKIASVYATGDRIYIVDSQARIVRSYDLDGVYLGNLGRAGAGPGEYLEPRTLGGSAEGNLFVSDTGKRQILVYTSAGEPIGSIATPRAACCAHPMVVTPGGTAYVEEWDFASGTLPPARAMHGYRLNGSSTEPLAPPEIEYEKITVDVGGEPWELVPFAHGFVWSMTPSGAMVAGASDRYRFEIHPPGTNRLVVEKYWEPVAVRPPEADWFRRAFIDTYTREEYVPRGWSWDGAEIPAHKPAYAAFVPTHSGEVWVLRQGAGERMEECTDEPGELRLDEPCWRDRVVVEVFGAEGRYLGGVKLPEVFDPFAAMPFVRDDLVIAAVMDHQGTLYVKRYRLVIPE